MSKIFVKIFSISSYQISVNWQYLENARKYFLTFSTMVNDSGIPLSYYMPFEDKKSCLEAFNNCNEKTAADILPQLLRAHKDIQEKLVLSGTKIIGRS